jgi:hypothetical protein
MYERVRTFSTSLRCPSCGGGMASREFDGHLGSEVQLDVCAGCHVIWFDHFESLRLSPAGTLRVFQLIGTEAQSRPPLLRDPLTCPRCDVRLELTRDRQRNTPFQYWRCTREHGRLITYFEFLREKDFIRPLSPEQLASLRENLQMINCSNCGAPIDLVHEAACRHCGTPISTLDLEQISRMANQLQRSSEPRKTIDVSSLFEAMKMERERGRTPDGVSGLVEAGLRLLAGWIP